jgi:RNA polymerase sigma-70 factor (ECF subfamily)
MQLRIFAGPEMGRIFVLEAGKKMVLGRSLFASNQSADPKMSRVHCEVWLESDQVRVRDCGSRNGTLVNGHPVTKHALQPGDVIGFGGMAARLEETDPPPSSPERLSHIETLRRLLHQAHGSRLEVVPAAQERLLQRYGGAVHHYLHGALRDPALADDLFQEFALRFLRGDFRRANPQRGRFRDYLRTALIHLVHDQHRARQQQPQALPAGGAMLAAPPVDDAESVQMFLTSWRAELLERIWQALAQSNPAYYAVLRRRIQEPELESAQLAEKVGDPLGKAVTAAWVRKTLQRARDKFAALFLEEVAQSRPFFRKPCASVTAPVGEGEEDKIILHSNLRSLPCPSVIYLAVCGKDPSVASRAGVLPRPG